MNAATLRCLELRKQCPELARPKFLLRNDSYESTVIITSVNIARFSAALGRQLDFCSLRKC